jgi:hypothetical protein
MGRVRPKPIVRNKDGIVIWQPDDNKFHYCGESTGKDLSCTWFISGGVVIIRDPSGEVVEAYKLRDGETVEAE